MRELFALDHPRIEGLDKKRLTVAHATTYQVQATIHSLYLVLVHGMEADQPIEKRTEVDAFLNKLTMIRLI